MKRWLLLTLAMCGFLFAQAADITSISNALKQGNSTSLTGKFDKEADIALPGSSKRCDEKEAIAMLSTFFSGNKPKDFKLLHHADKKESGFFVGKISTATGEYRVNITYRAEGNKAIIQSIRIE